MPPHPIYRNSGNLLLDRLPDEEFQVLKPALKSAPLAMKQIVQEYDHPISHIYFPTTAMVSLLTVLEEDDPVECMTVGREGFVGASAALGVETSLHRALCQLNGETMRVGVAPFRDVLSSCPGLNRLVNNYLIYMMRSVGQTLACNALHTVESRACRWLLITHDQAGGDEFPITQEFLAFMLGVRRQTVTVVAGSLQGAGLIEYRRGAVRVVDRVRLEDAACECYKTIRDSYQSILK